MTPSPTSNSEQSKSSCQKSSNHALWCCTSSWERNLALMSAFASFGKCSNHRSKSRECRRFRGGPAVHVVKTAFILASGAPIGTDDFVKQRHNRAAMVNILQTRLQDSSGSCRRLCCPRNKCCGAEGLEPSWGVQALRIFTPSTGGRLHPTIIMLRQSSSRLLTFSSSVALR